ncbi:MAG: tetratricopeptide repeat protein [Planctomycetota bacterium]|jgi:hypothetical protein
MAAETSTTSTGRARIRYVPVVGPRLRRLLVLVFALFAVLGVNSVYLVTITVAGVEYQNYFYQWMFLIHLVLGLGLIVPVVVFGIFHIRNARNRPNRRAIRAGYGLFAAALVVLLTGLILTRVDVFGARFEVNAPLARSTAYWLHVLGPLVAVWLFVLHRLAGRRIKWRVGVTWAAVAGVFAAVMLVLQTQDPRAWHREGPASGDVYFQPSFARTSSGDFIPARVLHNDQYCLECHQDVHDQWAHSVHRFSSFNNPVYLFSIQQTRRTLMERDGSVRASRFCAGCHDPVPFFSGAFDDPKFDDPAYDLSRDAMAQAGITCTACHGISHVNTVRGNGDFTIDEPVHYPFTFSERPFLRWVNRQLVKAKPEFHKATFLKPDIHRSTEFCGACHKVHIPEALNDYKWLRGQNHFDSFWLSGVSGQGIASFYYPAEAETSCNGCHMPLVAVSDAPNFSARVRDESGLLKTLDHLFPSANTAMPRLVADRMRDPEAAIEAHRTFNEDVMRVDIFGLKAEGLIDGELTAPIRPDVPVLEPGRTYLLETVIRTVKMGHLFTQGTVDSNQVWLDVTVRDGERVIGRSGGMEPDGTVDPWAHFVNAFLIDREGNRINRRNVEDIFIALYDHQIPPGAADVVHYRLAVPPDATGPITVEVRLLYRKFDTELMRFVTGDDAYVNDLPIMTLATDVVTFPLAGATGVPPNRDRAVEPWERWNDYGIGLLRKGQFGELRQAAAAFAEVERRGRAEGPLNLARVYLKEGLVQADAPDALARAAGLTPPAPEWSLLWFGALVAERNGDYDDAIAKLREIVRGGFPAAVERGFDFSKDYRVLNELAAALYQRGLQERGEPRRELMTESRGWYEQALAYDPENLAAHWGMKQVCRDLGDLEREAYHAAQHARYKPDDNARDFAAAQARLRYPAANRAAEAVVIHDLHRAEAPGLPADEELARHD